ncbi:MAG: hypothetical protein K2H56_02080 [Malacoplasma sp.]|nr:hypothetical protein [Malacoplasma sp.]MDE5775025.1 hypothetical protein [Malacoplasma sp.]MDE7099999.1 hypothetical protein [Malacoplasma sp.]
MRIKKKSILLSSAFLAIAGIGAPIILTSCGNTTSQNNSDYDNSDEKNGKVKDIVNNPETDGTLKYEIRDTTTSSSSQSNKILAFVGSGQDESGNPLLKSVDQLKKDIAPSRNDWDGPTSDPEGDEIYKLSNYSDSTGFQNFLALTNHFYVNNNGTNGTELDKNDLDANNILSNALFKDVEISKNSSVIVDEQQHASIAVIITISLKPDFVWKSNGLDYNLSFTLFLADENPSTT